METRQGPSDNKLTQLKCWPQVQNKIRAGEKIVDIVKYIQVDQKEYGDVKTDSLRRQLARIKIDIAPGGTTVEQAIANKKLEELKELADMAKTPDLPEEKKKTVYINVLEKAGELFTIQMERLEMGRTLENTLKYLIKTLTSDVGEARECLKFVFEIQQELGIHKKQPLDDIGDARFRTLTFEGRQRVLKALDIVRDKLKVAEIEDKRLERAAQETIIEVVPEMAKAGDDLPFE